MSCRKAEGEMRPAGGDELREDPTVRVPSPPGLGRRRLLDKIVGVLRSSTLWPRLFGRQAEEGEENNALGELMSGRRMLSKLDNPQSSIVAIRLSLFCELGG